MVENTCNPSCDNEPATSFPFAIPPREPCCDPDGGGTVSTELDNQITSIAEEGCANGVPYTRRTDIQYNKDGVATYVGTFYISSAGTTTTVAPAGWALGSCGAGEPGTADIVASCDDLGMPTFVGGSILPNTTLDDSIPNQDTYGPGWFSAYPMTDDGGGSVVQQGQAAVVMIEPGEVAFRATPNDIGTTVIGWQNLDLEQYQTYRLRYRLNAAGPGELQWFVDDNPVGNPVTVTNGTQQYEWFYTHSTATSFSTLELRLISGPSNAIISLDGIMFQRYVEGDPPTTTPIDYVGTHRVVIEQIVSTSGCADGVRDGLLKDIVDILGGPDSELRTVVGTVEEGCANGVPVNRTTTVRYTNAGVFSSSDTGYSFSDGSFTTVMPEGFRLGACPPVAPAAIVAMTSVEVTNEIGCADGVPYILQSSQVFDDDGNPIGLPILRWINSAGTATSVAPANFRLGQCDEPCCPTVAGEVCWTDGESNGRAFAIRLANGTLEYIDQAGGGIISSAWVVLCDEDVPVEAVNGAVTRTTETAAGTVAAGAASVTIINVGSAAGTVLGAALNAGETISVNAYYDHAERRFVRVPAVTYDATGTTFHITRQA